MKIANHYTFDAPRERIWPLIYNPTSLVRMIPGCEKLEQVSPDEYRGEIQLKLPAISGTFQTYVRLLACDEPNSCRFEGEVSGSAGSIRGTASFNLEPAGQQTHMAYEGQAIIMGPLARLDSRFIEGVADALIKQGLAKLNQEAHL